MLLDLTSLKPTIFLFDHAFILLISMLAEFTSSLTESPQTYHRKFSANANDDERLAMLRYSILFC